LGLEVWWFIWFLGRLGNDGHNGNLKVFQLQRSPTFVTNCEHLRDFGVKNVSGANGRNLPNDTITGEVLQLSIEFLQTKIALQQEKLFQMLECKLEGLLVYNNEHDTPAMNWHVSPKDFVMLKIHI
jgi:hypothetical protein